MRQRLLKYLRRFLILFAIVGVLVLAGFTYICYWPLESGVTDLAQLIPEQAEFVLRGSYDEIKGTGWIQHNLLDAPLHASLEDFAQGTGDPRAASWPQIKRQLGDLNRQINEQIPLGIVDFDIERDVLAGELLVAGVWCEGSRPPRPPGWQEILLMKRLSWKPRAGLAAALDHAWIRDMALKGQGIKFEHYDGEIYRVVVRGMRVRSQLERSGCGRGYTIPPDNEWYVTRVRDVVAVSNSPNLMKEVQRLSRLADNHGEGFRARDWFEIEPSPGRVVAAIDVEPLQAYLTRLLEEALGDRRKLLLRYLQPRSFERLNGSLALSDQNQLAADARIMLRSDVIGDNPELQALYRMPQASLTEGLAQFLPATDTWLTATVRSRPMHFFSAVLDMLTDSERKLLNENLRRAADKGGMPYRKVEDVLEELAPRLGDTAWIAVGRLSEIYDKIEYPEWYASEDDPYPAFTFMMRIREGASLAEVDDFLRGKAPLMGLKKEMERKEHNGIPYTRLFLQKSTVDFVHVKPCYYLAQDRFIFCNNEDYFLKVLETIADPSKSLARSEKYRVAMERVASDGHMGLYVDLAGLLAVPPDDSKGAGPRGFLWDLRNQHVTDTVRERQKALDKLAEFKAAFERENKRRPNDQEMERLYDRRDQFMEGWRHGYSRLVEEYRQELASLSRFRSLAFSVGAQTDELAVRLAIGLDDPAPGDE